MTPSRGMLLVHNPASQKRVATKGVGIITAAFVLGGVVANL